MYFSLMNKDYLLFTESCKQLLQKAKKSYFFSYFDIKIFVPVEPSFHLLSTWLQLLSFSAHLITSEI